MALPSLSTQHLTAYLAVQQVRLSAVAEDAGSIAPAHANVMEHSRLLQKLLVKLQLGVTTTNKQATVGDLSRMKQ
jgi:hypothetical protein